MKISYRREMKHNYLIVDPEELTWRNYECKMLSVNAIDGVLQFQLRQIDDEIRFYYEITSRQPLSRMLENHPVREPEIRQIILGISRILDHMERYLLRENGVLLEPDYIYVEPENFQIWLCLVPGLERDFPYDYGKLLEYLLGKVDHQDKESVILAYGLYQETRKENYGMEDILRLMSKCGKKEGDSGPETERESQQEPIQEQQRENERIPQQETRQKIRKGVKPEWRDETADQKRNHVFWRKFKARWTNWKHNQEKPAYNQEAVPWEQLFRDDLQTEAGLSDFVEKCDLKQNVGRNTTLLADLSSETMQGERKLCALDSGIEDIGIFYYPFIIGKQEHLVDHYLDHETVSRLHVRIDRTDDGWTIQDLNSSNGTMVAGKLLENNESTPLHLGDEVKIADLRYRFA